MSYNIRFKRGNSTNLPTSAPSGTPLFCEDTNTLYIGTGNSIKRINATTSSMLSMPVGLVAYFATPTPPEDFLVCNGGEVLRTLYSDLFNAIGTTFGSGDGETTFNLPLMTDGRFIKGSSTIGTLQNSTYPSHYHSYSAPSACSATTSSCGDHSHVYLAGTALWTSTYAAGGHNHSYSAPSSVSATSGASGSGSEVLPKNITVLPCIKYQ